MKRFKSILLVCRDGSDVDTVISRALALARTNSARVTLVDVLEAESGDLAGRLSMLPRERAEEVEAHIHTHYKERLERKADAFRSAGIEVDTELLLGTRFLSIIRRVLAQGHDLVLAGAEPSGGGARFLASDDMHLLRKCPCPVWLLKPDMPPRSRKIMAAVDPDTDEKQRTDLNRTVMELASSLAAGDGAELHVVHAWRLQEESALRNGRFAMAEAEIASILNGEETRHRLALDELVASFPALGQSVRTELIKGLPGDAISAYAAENDIDTIVMGTVGRTGVSGFFIGNTAETILSSVSCSLLTAKPPGFRSPVHVDSS